MNWVRKLFRQKNAETTCDSTISKKAEPGTQVGPRVMVRADNPVRRVEDDLLGRTDFAKFFARQILTLDTTEGAVVGVLGAWGAGKTSFVNLARAELEKENIPVLDFNPWMFSGAEQLVESFFAEIAAQLRMHRGLGGIGESLAAYGEAFSGLGWLPFVGPWVDRTRDLAKIVGDILKRRKEGVDKRRKKLADVLAKLSKPILVVIDDIDRLSTSEIRDVFKLVRLTASFPNIVYIVAFDRVRVEEALGEQRIPGRDYLEKILQLAIDLPAIPNQVLTQQIITAVNDSLNGIETPGPFDERAWPDLLMEVIRPLIRTMRDVRRYAGAAHGTVASLGGRIALADVLALEAIRLFLPDVFAVLHSSVEGLTTASELVHGGNERPRLKAQVEALLGAAEGRSDVIKAMIFRLFPAAQRHVGGSHYGSDWSARWLRERRVAHEDILRLYLERIPGEGLIAFTDADQAWAHMTDAGTFDRYLRSLDLDRRQNAIGSLEVLEGQFDARHAIPGATVLLNMLPDFPDRLRSMFEPGGRIVLTRVIYRLLRSLKDPNAIEAAADEILPQLNSLSAKLQLISQIGYREGAGHKLVSEAAATKFERTWRDEVRSTSADRLASECDLAWVLGAVARDSDLSEGTFDIPSSPDVTLAVLDSALSYSISQPMDSRAVQRSARLPWKVLIQLYGDEDTLRSRIEELKQAGIESSRDTLDLAEKYLRGEHPKDFDE